MDKLKTHLPSREQTAVTSERANTGHSSPLEVESLDDEPTCKVCHDRQWVSVPREQGVGFRSEACPVCWERPKREVILRRSGVPSDMIEMCRLETYRPQTRLQNQALAECREWVAGKRPPVLLLLGPVGVGKSHLALAVMGDLADKGIYGHYTTAAGIFDRLRRATKEGDFDDTWDWYCSTSVLGLSDLGAQRPTDFVEERLFELIDHRIETAFGPPILLSVITSNLSPEQLGDDRIRSRLQNKRVVHTVEIDGPDMRPRLTPVPWGSH